MAVWGWSKTGRLGSEGRGKSATERDRLDGGSRGNGEESDGSRGAAPNGPRWLKSNGTARRGSDGSECTEPVGWNVGASKGFVRNGSNEEETSRSERKGRVRNGRIGRRGLVESVWRARPCIDGNGLAAEAWGREGGLERNENGRTGRSWAVSDRLGSVGKQRQQRLIGRGCGDRPGSEGKTGKQTRRGWPGAGGRVCSGEAVWAWVGPGEAGRLFPGRPATARQRWNEARGRYAELRTER